MGSVLPGLPGDRYTGPVLTEVFDDLVGWNDPMLPPLYPRVPGHRAVSRHVFACGVGRDSSPIERQRWNSPPRRLLPAAALVDVARVSDRFVGVRHEDRPARAVDEGPHLVLQWLADVPEFPFFSW